MSFIGLHSGKFGLQLRVLRAQGLEAVLPLLCGGLGNVDGLNGWRRDFGEWRGIQRSQRGQRCGVRHHFSNEKGLFSNGFDGLCRIAVGVPVVPPASQSQSQKA